MKSKYRLTVACIAALGSHAGIVHSQEQDDSRGTGQVTSEPTEHASAGRLVSAETQENSIDGYSSSIIEVSLQEKINKLKRRDTIEVVIYLDTMIDDDESDFGSSGSATYFSDTNQLGNAEVTTSDAELNYAIEGINFEDQLVQVEQRRTRQSEKRLLRRMEKSQNTVRWLLKKLRKKRRFNRIISIDESAGIITAALRGVQ